MRRLLVIAMLLLGVSAWIVVTGAADDEGTPHYTVELDNAFGLIEGADLKVDGVRAGKITSMSIDRASKRALVEFDIVETGFGSLRSDVRCETRPQSLIGEYFLDCLPGTSSKELEPGATIPVTQTGSTVPPDLVNNILRRPYRERLSILLAELGTGVAARADDLNETVRRASPALRETNRVLRILGKQNKILGDLAKDADAVVTGLADNRKDVSRWVDEARDTAVASAERQQELAGTFRRLPAFLKQLGPTMRALGDTAAEQTPALRDLNASAKQLESFFDELTPFSDASKVSLESLGNAAAVGKEAVAKARPTIDKLNDLGRSPIGEMSKNLAIILEDLDDPERHVETNPDTARQTGDPNRKGFTGLEALLQYVFDQSMAINVFDDNGWILKVALFESECAAYQNATTLKAETDADPEFIRRCGAYLGPHQPGINEPDPTLDAATAAERRAERRAASKQGAEQREAASKAPAIDLKRTLDQLFGRVGDTVDRVTGGVTDGLGGLSDPRNYELLDYLLAP